MRKRKQKPLTTFSLASCALLASTLVGCELSGLTGEKKPSLYQGPRLAPSEPGLERQDGAPGSGPKTYWVSTAGNDAHAGLTRSSAFRTLAKALTTARPGDSVMVVAGTYRESIPCSRDVRIESPDGDGRAVISQFSSTGHTPELLDGSNGVIKLTPAVGYTPDIGMRRLYFVQQNGLQALRAFLAMHGKSSLQDVTRYPVSSMTNQGFAVNVLHGQGAIAEVGDFVELTGNAVSGQGVLTSSANNSFGATLLSSPTGNTTHFMLIGERFITQAKEFAPLTLSGQIKAQVSPIDANAIVAGTLQSSKLVVESIFGSPGSCQNTSMIGFTLVGDEIVIPQGMTLVRTTVVNAQ